MRSAIERLELMTERALSNGLDEEALRRIDELVARQDLGFGKLTDPLLRALQIVPATGNPALREADMLVLLKEGKSDQDPDRLQYCRRIDSEHHMSSEVHHIESSLDLYPGGTEFRDHAFSRDPSAVLLDVDTAIVLPNRPGGSARLVIEPIKEAIYAWGSAPAEVGLRVTALTDSTDGPVLFTADVKCHPESALQPLANLVCGFVQSHLSSNAPLAMSAFNGFMSRGLGLTTDDVRMTVFRRSDGRQLMCADLEPVEVVAVERNTARLASFRVNESLVGAEVSGDYPRELHSNLLAMIDRPLVLEASTENYQASGIALNRAARPMTYSKSKLFCNVL